MDLQTMPEKLAKTIVQDVSPIWMYKRYFDTCNKSGQDVKETKEKRL